jgi:hypothetical protein
MSTFAVIYLLDECLFSENLSAGIVSYSLEHSQYIFKKIIGHAIDNFASWIKPFLGVVQRSARDITFENGSTLRVDTTLRGGAYQLVLVSEYGKTCARNPIKAEEVITGTLQTVPKEGRIIIESTGEGNSGYFADMVNKAYLRGNDNLSPLDYRLFFFPWYMEKQYVLPYNVDLTTEQIDYFKGLEKEHGIILNREQKNWYANQQLLLGDKMKQEFCSTVSEAFLSSSDAYYFQEGIELAYKEHRMLSTSPYDPIEPVYVSMDIGINDLTVLVFFQVVHGEIRVLDYFAANGKGVDFYCHYLQAEKRYIYHTIFLPHDAAKRDGIVVENSYEREFKKLFSNTATRFVVLKRTDVNININNAKIKLGRCVFNLTRTKPLIDMLVKFRKKWSESLGKFLDEYLHDISSDYAFAFIYMAQAVTHIETVGNMSGALEKHKEAVENRKYRI